MPWHNKLEHPSVPDPALPLEGTALKFIECAFFGAQARFHHIGMAVESIRDVCPDCDIFPNPARGVSMAFVRLHGITLELLEPLGANSPIARSLQSGTKILHLCFEVPDLDTALDACHAAGFHRLGPPAPSPAFDNRRIAWVFSRSYGLVELAERNRAPAANTGNEAASDCLLTRRSRHGGSG
jgi:methylmalonyl-CoA/ethylmalonyl-CoA epimerase